MSQTSSQANYTVPVVVGGLVGAVLSVVPPCCCLCCFNAVIAGAIAGWMFARAAGFPPIERGALVGALAGALAGAGRAVLSALWDAASAPWVEGWVDQLTRYGDAEAREMLEQWGALESVGGPGWFLASLVTSVGVGAVLGALGGMLGLAMMRRQPPPPPAQYPVPPPPFAVPPVPPPPDPGVAAEPPPVPPVPPAEAPWNAPPPAPPPWPPTPPAPPPEPDGGEPPAGDKTG